MRTLPLSISTVAGALGLALLACGDDDERSSLPEIDAGTDPSPDAAADAAPDAARPDAAPAVCDTRCAPEQSLEAETCTCSSAGVRMRLLPLDAGFYAQPWPLDTRLRANGALDLDGFPFPATAAFVATNLPILEQATRGFSTNGAIYAGFDGELDPETLPGAEESLAAGASVYLVEVEPDSPTRGERTPITCAYRAAATDYNPAHLLACAPVAGFPLRPATRHALVLTDALLDAQGEPLRASQRWLDVLAGHYDGEDTVAAGLLDAYAPLADFLLGEGAGLAHVIGGTVFTTQDPTAELRALRDFVRDDPVGAPSSVALHAGALPAESGNYVALEGTLALPNFQQGDTPFELSGGDIHFDAEGIPEPNGTLPVRFALTLPEGAMPEDGWPLVLYHHGTGGDAYSFIEDGTAFHLAAAGAAAIGIDAPVHGTRNPSAASPDLLFFNVGNLLALRDNVRQGAVDLLALESALEAFVLSAGASPTGSEIRFDTARVFALGHSQGGLTVPLMLPLSTHVRGALLSGAGASITASILHKTAPIDIPAIARAFLALPPGEPLDAFHPVLTLVQAFSEVADPSNYAPYLYRWEGGRAVDLWATQGLLDTYAPKPVTDALVTALGLEPLAPLAEPVPGFELLGVTALPAPVSGNVTAADGSTHTAVYSQYPEGDHFLIMDDPDAEAQLTHWFRSLIETPRGELIAP